MPMCSFSGNYHMFDITPIENLFIHEFMLKAPGDFVKVYIYGLKQCYHPHGSENSVEAFTHALELDPEIIVNAFHYWSRQGILQFSQDENRLMHIEYYNIKDVLYNRNLNTEKDLYKYKDFNHNLQQIFESRLLTPQEYMKIYDWIETLNLPMEVVLMMVQFNLAQKGAKLNINYLDKVAESWAKEGINTLQKAEEYIESNQSYFRDTTAVLKYLGIHRLPSKAELTLYKKWQDQWGFSLNAILAACKETTKISSPNLSYLDKILSGLHSLGVKTHHAIDKHLKNRESVTDRLKEVYYQLGYKDTASTPEHLSMYMKWIEDSRLDHGVILLACKQCVRKKSNTFENLDNMLLSWVQNGLTTEEDIKKHIAKRKALDNEVQAVLERSGESRNITSGDRKLYHQWTEEWKLPFELILQAAEYSVMAQNKLPFLNKILSGWHNKNITSLSEAKADHARHIQALALMETGKGTKKQLDFNQFTQRTYSEDELEHLFEDFQSK